MLACSDDEAREDWLEEFEQADGESFGHDKAWDALHRSLGDGELVVQDGPPLAHAVFGSQPLMELEDTDTFASLLPADEVAAVADALEAVDRDRLRTRYDALGATDYDGELDDEDFEYTWANVVEFRPFPRRAADVGAAVVFTV